MSGSNQYDDEIRAAKDARRVLDDPVFKKAFSDIESALIDQMRSVPMADIETQHELVLTLQLLGNLKSRFTTAVDTGKMAELTKTQMLAQKAKKFLGR